MNWRTSILTQGIFLSAVLLVTAGTGLALETDTFVVTDLSGHLSPERQQTLTRQAQAQLDQVLRFYQEPSRVEQLGKIHLKFDQPRKGVYATVFLMEDQGKGKGKGKDRVVWVFGADREPQQLAHKLTHASFPSPDKLIRNMMGIPMEMRFGNPLSFPMCGYGAADWVVAFRQKDTYIPLAELGPHHEQWGMTTENGVPVTRDRPRQHIMYAESAAFGDFLLRTYGAERMKRFWQQSQGGKRPWEEVFGSSFSQLEAAWWRDLGARQADEKTVKMLLGLFNRNPREACTQAQMKAAKR